MNDYLVVGSGMSAIHAALTLLEAGQRVCILDIGERKEQTFSAYENNDDFYTRRRNSDDQYQLFLGESFQGVSWGSLKNTLAPPRQYIAEQATALLPYTSEDFNLLQSSSLGGLGNAWGAGAAPYLDEELKAMGLPKDEMRASYRTIAKRIGLSGRVDDAQKFFELSNIPLDPALKLDPAIESIQNSYCKKRSSYNRKNIFLGKTPMAVISRSRTARDAYRYRNMDFYDDVGFSVYRPHLTFDQLLKFERFSYIDNSLVLTFTEHGSHVEVKYKDLTTGSLKSLTAKKLFLAAGTFGSARIVLRSIKSAKSLPILTNDYSIATFLHLRSIGNSVTDNLNSLGQLEMFYSADDALQTRMASLYTYSSLTLSRLVSEVPMLSIKSSRRMLAYLQSSLVIASFNHPDFLCTSKEVRLLEPSAIHEHGQLQVDYKLQPATKTQNRKIERRMIKAMLGLGCVPLVKRNMQYGSSVHYAGTMPINDTSRLCYLNENCGLNGSRNVYVIDGSGFRMLPANGLTFSLMANADRVARLSLANT